MNKRILITGASGFIGRYLVDEALSKDYEVWAAVRPSSSRVNLSDPRIHFIEIDYTSTEAVRTLVDSLAPEGEAAWHIVIHNAGITKSKSLADFVRINAEYTKHLVEGLALCVHKPERFVLISSLSSYGPTASPHQPLKETDPQRPNTAYGYSKLRAEQYVSASGIPYSILLLTGVYGPGDMDYLMAIRSISHGFDFVAGLSTQYLSFVYAADAARAALFVATHAEADGQRYMVSDGRSYTDVAFGQMVRRLLGSKSVLHLRIPLSVVWIVCVLGDLWGKLSGRITPLNRDKYRILSQRSWLCDDSSLRALGFTPQVQLEEGLQRTIKDARVRGILR